MKSIWKQEVELLFCAIFKIKEKIILQNPVSQILSGSYLEKYITKIVPNSELLQKNIAAITYGVSLDIAEQIPMRKYINYVLIIMEPTSKNTLNILNLFLFCKKLFKMLTLLKQME
jgi:hypothetical protein